MASVPWEAISLNLPANSASLEQRAVLDALPVLVFLERAGRIVFANAEVRRMLGTEGEWVERPVVEDVLWGLFPRHGGAADAAHRHAQRQSISRHPAYQGPAAPAQVEGAYSLIDPTPARGDNRGPPRRP